VILVRTDLESAICTVTLWWTFGEVWSQVVACREEDPWHVTQTVGDSTQGFLCHAAVTNGVSSRLYLLKRDK